MMTPDATHAPLHPSDRRWSLSHAVAAWIADLGDMVITWVAALGDIMMFGGRTMSVVGLAHAAARDAAAELLSDRRAQPAGGGPDRHVHRHGAGGAKLFAVPHRCIWKRGSARSSICRWSANWGRCWPPRCWPAASAARWPPSWARCASPSRSTPCPAWAPIPIHYLVVPRFLGCLLLIPTLTIMADFMGVVGGCVLQHRSCWASTRITIGRTRSDFVGTFDLFRRRVQEPVLRRGDRADQLPSRLSLRSRGRRRRPRRHERVRLFVRRDPDARLLPGHRAGLAFTTSLWPAGSTVCSRSEPHSHVRPIADQAEHRPSQSRWSSCAI